MEDTPRRIPAWVVTAYAALILLRMFLVSHDEFLPWGADSGDYASASMHDLWFGQERGGVSWMASVARHLGLPFKLALDAAYVGLSLLAARRIVRATDSEAAGLITFFLLAFSSYFFRASLLFLSDPAVACLILAAVLVFSRFASRPISRWTWLDALGGGVVLALWALTRREEPIIFAGLGLLALVVVFFHRIRWHEGLSPRALLLLIPAVLMLGSGEAVRLRNLAVHHVSAQSAYSGPGSGALLGALYSVPPDREIRFCPVTRGTLEAAAKVSPTLQPLLPELLDPQNVFRRYASERYHVPGEVCTWLNFLLLDTYGRAYSVQDGSADQAMLRTAREIRAAQAAGKLGRRTTFYPVDPLWRQWLPELPHAFIWGAWNSFGLHSDVSSDARVARQKQLMPLAMERDFSQALLQRGSLLEQGELDVSGTLEGDKASDAAQFVLLREGDAVIGASPVYPFTDLMHVARFDIGTRPLDPGDTEALEFYKDGQLVQSEPLPRSGKAQLQLGQGAETWNVSVWRAATTPSTARRLQEALLRANDFILLVGLLACAAIAFLRARNKLAVDRFELIALALAALCFLFPRIGFYALLDVWLRWDSMRYFSADSGAALLGIIGAAALAGSWLGAPRPLFGGVLRPRGKN